MELHKKIFSYLDQLREQYDYISSWFCILFTFYTMILTIRHIFEALPFPWYLTLLISLTCLIWVFNGFLYLFRSGLFRSLTNAEVQSKPTKKTDSIVEAIQSYEDYYDILCDLISHGVRKDLRDRVEVISDKCIRFYRAYGKELGLQYNTDELNWLYSTSNYDALTIKIRNIIEQFKKLRDKEKLNPNSSD